MKRTYSNVVSSVKASLETLRPPVKRIPEFLSVYGPYRAAIMTARQRGVKPMDIVLELERHGVSSAAMRRMRKRGLVYSGPVWGACIMIGKLCNHKG
jgi:hypothetical protein